MTTTSASNCMSFSIFAWQRALISSPLPDRLRMTALRVALDSTAATGRNVVINESAVAADVGCSVRTVWRHIAVLVEVGWLAQTAKPAYVGARAEKRRAQYRLLIPGQTHHESSDTPPPAGVTRQSESSDINPPGMSHDSAKSSDTVRRKMSDDSGESSDTPPPAGVTRQPESSDTPGGGLAHFPPTTTTAAAARAKRPQAKPTTRPSGPVVILAAKLAHADRRLEGLRTDIEPDKATRIESLIDVHGDRRLVETALIRLHEPMPKFITAFLESWSALPPPGTLQLVQESPCPVHGHPGTTRHCIGCAADNLVAGR